MKKLLAVLLALTMLFAFAACGGEKSKTDAEQTATPEGFEILLEKGEDMKNTYSHIACNPDKLEGINVEGANALIEWMTGSEASALIADYGKEQYGQALFYLLDDAADAEESEKTETAEKPENSVIRMSTTTSVNDSGLLPYLLPVFEKATGYTVEVQSAGTGAAIQKAKDGNADLILVHAKASEEEFVSEGYGVERIPFMYNYFVIVGPSADPAGIAGCENAAEAFAKIRDTKSTFISRGDDSGTHKAEKKIWGENVPDAETDEWYVSAGQGMGACLSMAKQMNGYCLTDKATFLSMAE